MITTDGKLHIQRYLAGYVPAIAQSMVFGTGDRAEALGDIALHLQTTQSTINLVYPDFVSNKLGFKATVPDSYVGKVYEVGLYTLAEPPVSIDYGSRLLTTFDSASEDWLDTTSGLYAAFGSTSTRIGADSLLHTPALSSTTTSSLSGMQIDLYANSSADSFTFAFNVANANTNQIVFKFMTNSSNYYSFTLASGTVGTAGYKVIELTKGSAVVTGAPSWDNITEIQVSTTSKASGASSVEFEAIRIEDKDSQNIDYILVARKVLSTPVTKVTGQPLDIEFTMDITV